MLPQAGVPKEVADAVSGANVNSQSFKARGLELSGDGAVSSFHFSASYTYLDAEVTESFASGALSPAINPLIPGVPIGAFAPLVGARPFRRPVHWATCSSPTRSRFGASPWPATSPASATTARS